MPNGVLARASFGRAHRRGARFELIPMIDVFMIITLFLMVMAFLPQISEALRADLTSSRTGEKTPPSVLVQLTKEGTIMFQGHAIAPEVLEGRMKGLVAGKADLAVIVAADKQIPFEKVVGLIDRLKVAGVKRLALATAKPHGAPQQ
ncbi:MAG: biopolymer transporter ExbD [Candidatus Sericytochromatia bacterium]|nr:biopolymer transporter ExbD [Candidatus Tanganyikabacteria bacterium]